MRCEVSARRQATHDCGCAQPLEVLVERQQRVRLVRHPHHLPARQQLYASETRDASTQLMSAQCIVSKTL